MKRRRQTLQVSTFPFLAVLLCTMGSLILILMVMDRRARLVALARIQNAVAQRTAEQEAAERARKAEWERARQALRESLENRLRKIRGEKGATEEKARQIVHEISTVEAARQELHSRLQAQRAELSQKDRELQQQGVAVTARAKLTENARAELFRLTADLDALEKTLVDLKALRQKKEEAFSLVPYRGKHGDNRRPIYVECTSRGVVFHPGRLALDGYEVSPLAIRKEIDRRLAQFRGVAAPDESKESPAYVLMLLRPSGIRNYYQFVSALAGLKIDFGYELLEEGWEIAFADDDRPARPLSWAGGSGNGSGMDNGGVGGAGNARSRPGGSWEGAGSGTGFGGASPGSATGIGVPGTGHRGGGAPGITGTTPGNGSGTGIAGGSPGTAAGNGSGAPHASLGSPLTTNGHPAGATGSGAPHGGGWSPLMGNGGPARPANQTAGTTTAANGSHPGQAAGGSALPGTGQIPIASSQSPTPGNGSPTGGTGSAGQPGNSQTEGNGKTAQAASEGGQPGGSAVGSRPAAAGTAGGTAGGTEVRTPGGAGSGSPGQCNSTGDEQPPADRPPPDQRRQFRDPLAPPPAGGTSGQRNPLARPGGPEDGDKPARPLRVGSNRDWIILVECTADAVLLPGTGQRFDLAQLQRRAGNDNPLLQAVRTVIARRQATVRPTEPEWKPQLRFLVHADGLRSYYAAFPALEPLRLPMTKQNRQEKEEE